METLQQGDCIETMQSMERESIDMIFADPPFNLGKKFGGKSAWEKARATLEEQPSQLSFPLPEGP